MGMSMKKAVGVAGLLVATTAAAQVTLYSRDDFRGRQFTTDRVVRNMDWVGFNDRASSVVIRDGDWQVCEDAEFSGRCAVLRPGEYRSLADMGLDNEISSLRPVEGRYGYNDRHDRRAYVAGAPDYRRHRDERIYEVPVTDVRAVVGPPEQRCWVERGEFHGNPNVPGAIAGAVIGGILGHQIGGGHGQDVATAGGAVAGAAIGANVGRDERYGDVQRCTDVSQYDRPDYWDVTYEFRGRVHHVQMSSPPGATIMVNADGEPRV
ncbi:MAG: beta/gamma crystallin-related protein [Rudaea sp.]